jgi:hypothetical protein
MTTHFGSGAPPTVFVTPRSSDLTSLAGATFDVLPAQLSDIFDVDRYRDGTDADDGRSFVVAGDLSHDEAAYVSAKGAIWCRPNSFASFNRHVMLIDAAGAWRQHDLGPFPPPKPKDKKPGARGKFRGLWRSGRRIARSFWDWRLLLAFAALTIVLVTQTLVTNSLPLNNDWPFAAAKPDGGEASSLQAGAPPNAYIWAAYLAGALVVGFIAFAAVAKSVLSARVEEGRPTRRARTLIMGLSHLPKLSADEFDDLRGAAAKPPWYPTLEAIFADGRLFRDRHNQPIHPISASQIDAAFELPLDLTAMPRGKVHRRLKTETGSGVRELAACLRRRPSLPWQPNLCVIASQLDLDVTFQAGMAPPPRRLERIVVVTTAKSAKDYPLFAALVRQKLTECGAGDVEVCDAGRTVDAESFTEARDVLKAILDQPGRRDEDVVIDITALPRPFALAASVLTMNRELVFTYVNEEREITQYDGEVALSN